MKENTFKKIIGGQSAPQTTAGHIFQMTLQETHLTKHYTRPRETGKGKHAVKLLETERESELKSFPHVKQSSIDPVSTLRFMALKPSRKNQ